jgi:hypothetical protein
MRLTQFLFTCLAVGPLPLLAADAAGSFCPEIYRKGVLDMPFNASFLHVQSFNGDGGVKRDGLLMSSFFNVVKDPSGRTVERYAQRDLVALIRDLDELDIDEFDPAEDVQVLTDLDGVARQTWPNETSRVPDGVLPFEAVVSPQGFQVAPMPGRLTLIDVSGPALTEYIVDQSSFKPPRCEPGSADNQPWFYHDARFVDMDGDGLKDIVTVRSGFRVVGGFCPPTGELVWFRNPGEDLRPDREWEEFVLVAAQPEPGGPEINMNVRDLDGDGVVEILGSHFFKYDAITVYGPPKGQRWTDVDPVNGPFVRQKDIMRGQGNPFAVEVVDLNLDGRLDVLTSNHQGDDCFEVTKSEIPGRVIAIEQPADGRLFDSDWTVHVIKDDIRPNPTYPEPSTGPGRLAPNRAVAFWPARVLEGNTRPWIVVGGDEASKVWVLKPRHPLSTDRWEYDSAVILDINDYYGPRASQTLLDDPQGVSISTVGGMAWRYDRPGPLGLAELYIPVFEARDIHVLSFRPVADSAPMGCPADVPIACPN